jgi:hypothetical protein
MSVSPMPDTFDTSCESVSHLEPESNEVPWLDPKPLSTRMPDKVSTGVVDNDFTTELSFLREYEDLLFPFFLRGRGGKKFFLTCK